MIQHNFSICYPNVWHLTLESVLPIIEAWDKGIIKSGDSVLVPDYEIYPHEMIKSILEGVEVVRVHIPYHCYPGLPQVNSYLSQPRNLGSVKRLADSLLTHIDKRVVGTNAVYMTVRLHNRRWMPMDNVQKLIDALPDHNFYVIFHPEHEGFIAGKKIAVPEIKNATVFIDPSYKDQLELAHSCPYSICVGGAGSVYPQLTGKLHIAIVPCEASEREPNLMAASDMPKLKILTDKKVCRDQNGNHWNDDIEKVTVENVLYEFEMLKRR